MAAPPPNRRGDPKCPTRKERFRDWRYAEKVKKQIRRQSKGATIKRVYHCELCNGRHLTSKRGTQ